MTSKKEEQVISVKEGTLAYVKQGESICIKRYRGIGQYVEVPEQIDGLVVTEIAKKTFLSCKSLREIVLPETIEIIGDWAFAHAEQLKKVTMPRKELQRGKQLFLGCNRLREIKLSGEPEEIEEDERIGIPRMLAISVTALQDYFLLSPLQVKSQEWLAKWDERLVKLIQSDDLEGFEDLWTCGEEDYEGNGYTAKSYPVERRKSKIRLAYFRLLHSFGLTQETKDFLQTYLKQHTKGTKEAQAWEIVMEEHKEDIAYYQMFAEAGCIREDNFEALLQDMEEVNAQVKGFLLKYKEEHFEQKDAFAKFDLAW